MPRTLSPTLAAVVQDLELDQPTVITAATLNHIAARHHLRTSPKVIAARLRAAGWLLATGRRGVWEFAPGSHAGPIGHGDPTLPLRTALAATPALPAALSLSTAAWALGLADRVPGVLDVAVPVGTRVPAALRVTAVSTFTTTIGYTTAKGVPCHRPESVLVHLATSPNQPRSWESVLEWLPDLAAEANSDLFATEIADRARAVAVRAGYLLSGLRPDLARTLSPLAGDVVRFGARTSTRQRHSATWHVLDAVLPSDPGTWEPVA